MKVLISQKIKKLQRKPEGVNALRQIIVSAKFNEPRDFEIPSDNAHGSEKVTAQFVPIKGDE